MSDEKKIDYAKHNLDLGLDLAESHSEVDRLRAKTMLTASMAVSLYELRTAMIELSGVVTAVLEHLAHPANQIRFDQPEPVSDDAKSAHRSEHDPLGYDIVPER